MSRVLIYPDSLLRRVSLPVGGDDFGTGDLNSLVGDMIGIMRRNEGIGLAAPQLGSLKRMFITEVEPGVAKVVINPEVLSQSIEESEYKEGCLSVPGYFARIWRPESITVRYFNIEGKETEELLTGLSSTVFLHENDHLDGILFIDKLSKLKLAAVPNKIKIFLRRHKEYGR